MMPSDTENKVELSIAPADVALMLRVCRSQMCLCVLAFLPVHVSVSVTMCAELLI